MEDRANANPILGASPSSADRAKAQVCIASTAKIAARSHARSPARPGPARQRVRQKCHASPA
jgi:hypothetical protein